MSSATWALVASAGDWDRPRASRLRRPRGSGTSIGQDKREIVTISMRCASLSQTLMRLP
mgnify:CR=1 FL=1